MSLPLKTGSMQAEYQIHDYVCLRMSCSKEIKPEGLPFFVFTECAIYSTVTVTIVL